MCEHIYVCKQQHMDVGECEYEQKHMISKNILFLNIELIDIVHLLGKTHF